MESWRATYPGLLPAEILDALWSQPSTSRRRCGERGIGTELISASVARLRVAGCAEVILWMLRGNRRARGFYLRQGWRDDGGRRPSQYFPDLPGLVEVRFRREL